MTKSVEECRLCLTKLKPKNLTSLFQSVSGVFYYDMVNEIANIKICQDDGLPDKLCHICRRKVKELYDFKLLIESSDHNLRGSLHPKKINFSNINDVKLEISLVKKEKTNYGDFTEKLDFEDKENILYKDVVIRKLQPSTVKKQSNLLLIGDFLDSINHDDCGDDDQYTGHTVYDEAIGTDYGPSSNEEEDLEPTSQDLEDLPLAMRKIIRQNKDRARRLERRLLREEEEDENWNMPAQAQTKSGEKKKTDYQKDLNAVKRVRFNPPITKTHIKPEVWPNLRMVIVRKHKEKASICPHCGLKPTNLQTHLKTHTGVKQFTCVLCPNRSYYTKGGYRSHMLKHEGERNFKCETCTATFYTLALLTKHQTSHGESTFKCSYCDKMFKWRTGWLRHEKSHNAANKNIMCDMCNMSFFCKSGLRHHMRIHTGERPFQCEICNQPYSYKHDFNRHCMNKHGVFLKRRDVRVMNEEVLARERAITRGLVMRAHGIIQEGETYNPFEKDGPLGAMAFNQFLKDAEKGKVPLQLDTEDLQLQVT